MLFADGNCGVSSQLPEDCYSTLLEATLLSLSDSSPAPASAPLQKPGFPSLLQFENPPPSLLEAPPVRCLPMISAELAAVLGTLPQAGLADPRRRTAHPAASCPSAGCRCRRWAQSTSSALSCEQESGHPIR